VKDRTDNIVIVETSCDIHTGASGGMVITTSGDFVGLITQNTVQTDGVILPKLNGSLPGSFLGPILSPFLESRGEDMSTKNQFTLLTRIGSLRKLNEQNGERENIWNLTPSEEKGGTQLADFIRNWQSKL
jgi:hypothetical protein